jgi:LAS superfamily LD-carboxypeptidase LdcB
MNRFEFISSLLSSYIGLSSNSISFNLNQKNPLLIGKGFPELNKAQVKILKTVSLKFNEMKNDAKKEGINIKIVSGYRSFDRQKLIWNRKFLNNQKKELSPIENINKIIQYSTIPGTSRHHWGTEIDIIAENHNIKGDLLLAKNFHNNSFEPLRLWMEKNSYKFDFVLPYTKDSYRSGFLYEPWHYSYSKLSKSFLKEYIKLKMIEKIYDPEILGINQLTKSFLKSYQQKFILGINQKLLF